jgi:hypothetical protein
VLRPGGHILWFDAQRKNPHNRGLRAITPKELRTMFPHCRIQSERTMLVPFIARAVARRSWLLASALEKVPFARTHLAAIITPAK